MRLVHSTITPGVVHCQARAALQNALDWKPFRASVSVTDLLDLLLLMAACTASLFDTVRRFFSFSHETASRAIKANLPDLDRLTAGLVDALYQVAEFSRQDRRRHWLLAIDTHYVAYYGQRSRLVLGGPKKQGTKWFFGYATAVLLHKGRRYTVALCPLLPHPRTEEVVGTLLDQVAAKGLKIRGVVLDSAFDSGAALLLLQERHLAYTVPLRRKGRGMNARNRLFQGQHKLVRWAEWRTDRGRHPVRTRTVLWQGKPQAMVFAFQGWNVERASSVYQEAARQRKLYRRRFGIETSYRQKNQGRASTTSRDPVYRLLLEGLGYLLRQVWVVLTERIARARGQALGRWVSDLPLRRLVDWLVTELTRLHPEQLEISVP